MTSGQRITKLRKERDLQQKEVAAAIGMNRIVLNRIELGKRPLRDDEAVALADFFHVTTDYLLKGVTAQPRDKKGVRIPVLGRVVAGIPLDAIEEIIDYEEIPKSMAATGEFFALQVKGDSMLPTLKDGDVVIVKKQPTVDSGDIAIILVNGNEATVKEVKESPAGITLIGHNVAVYTPQFYSNEEIKSLPVQVLGKVVEMRRKF